MPGHRDLTALRGFRVFCEDTLQYGIRYERLAYSRLRRLYSCLSSFSRPTSEVSKPPYVAFYS